MMSSPSFSSIAVIKNDDARSDVTFMRSSSFEEIYDATTPPLEGDTDSTTGTDVTPGVVGDRFAPAQIESEALRHASSFEALYSDSDVPFAKEATHVEEKDVDELGANTDSDLDRSEKGAHEGEKYYVQSPPLQMFTSMRSDLTSDLELDLSSGRSSAAQVQSPLDVTLESGLDRVGQSDVTPVEDEEHFRERHFSTPELRRFAGESRRCSCGGVSFCLSSCVVLNSFPVASFFKFRFH